MPNGAKTPETARVFIGTHPDTRKMSNFFRKIFRRSEPAVKTSIPALPGMMRGGEPERVQSPESALAIATVYRCVALLSESVAALPLIHERRADGIFRPQADDLTQRVSVEPNEWMSAFDFWRLAVQTRLLFGEAYIVPRYHRDGSLKRLILARPGTAAPSTGIGLYMINDQEQGLQGEFEESDIIRIKGMSLDGIHCMSVIGYAARTSSLAATADRNTLTSFANGGAPLGILTNDSALAGYGQIQRDALQAAADRVNDSLTSGARLAALGGNWKLIQYGMSAADMQFLESRKFTVREICRFFGVHPSFVFDDTSNNYKSAEMANVAFLSNTLNPILRQIENELDRKLLPGAVGERLRFDREALYATDLESRMGYVEKRIQTGTMTPNEARASFGQPRTEGGDTLLVSANLKNIAELSGQTGPAPESDNQ